MEELPPVEMPFRYSSDGQSLLLMIGVRPDGRKERMAIGEGYRVSKASWQELLLDQKGRGLQAGPLLAVGDVEMGFWAALEEVFPATRGQRCWFHKMGNVLNALRKSLRGAPRRICGRSGRVRHATTRTPATHQGAWQREDNLTLTGKRATEAAQQEAAPQAVVRAQNMSLSLYTDGLDNYLNVTVAQIAALTAQFAEVQVQTRHLQTAIALIGAFGGWSTADLSTGDQTLPFNPLSPHDAPGNEHESH
jgi:hypothetical protein